MISQIKSSERPLVKDSRWQILTKPWRFLIITILVIGILFRFTNLDHKAYWWDEVVNSIHSAGYSKQDFDHQVEAWKGRDLTIEDLHQYQYPTSQTTSLDVIRALAEGEPQSPPIYYLLSRWWMQLFGSSVAVQRSLSAVISLLAFPSMYWLCLELFGSSLAAGIGVMLIASSPFHLLFAQEVRMYVLWTVTILISSACLLRAIRLQRKRDWVIYTASLIISFYTYPFSILVAVSHGIYVTVNEFPKFLGAIDRSRNTWIKVTKTFSNYLMALIISIIIYVPWIVLLTQIDDTKMSAWRQKTISLSELLKNWLFQTPLIFVDLNSQYLGSNGIENFYDPLSFYPMIFIWIFILFSFYFLVRNSPQQLWSFILPLILTTALALALPDIITGGIRSAVPRYLIPCYVGIELSIVNLIYSRITPQSAKVFTTRIWQLFLAIFLSLGIISCSLIISSSSWWNKSINFQNVPIAEIINSTEKPLILTPQDLSISLISISHHLTNKAIIRLIDQPDVAQESPKFSTQFLLNYPQSWLDSIKKEHKLKLEKIYQGESVEDPVSKLNFSLVRIL
ncbi:MAG: glycosyltransferase family 39 protein [Cyanobacteria bacterium P01_G01_bin.39]